MCTTVPTTPLTGALLFSILAVAMGIEGMLSTVPPSTIILTTSVNPPSNVRTVTNASPFESGNRQDSRRFE